MNPFLENLTKKEITKLFLKKFFILFLLLGGILFVLSSFLLNIKMVGQIVAQDSSIDNIFIINNFILFRLFLFGVGCMFLGIIVWRSRIQRIISLYRRELILFLAVSFICILLLEVFAFYVIKEDFSRNSFAGKEINYTNIEFNYSAKFNEYGFRDDPFIPTDNYKIALVGDSFVFGVGVQKNETFEKRIEEKFNRIHPEVPISVYNLGIPGAYPSDYLSTINEMSPILQPNLTIVVLYLGNDLVCTKEEKSSLFFFPNMQKLFQIFFQRYSEQQEIKAILASPSVKEEYKQYIQEQTINPYLFMSALYKPNLTLQYNERLEWFTSCPVNKNILKEIKTTTEQFGYELILVILPINYQVNDDNWKILADLGYIVPDKEMLQQREFQETILNFCKEQNMSCLDMLSYLQQSKEQVYYSYDGHFTPEGHAVTAEAILAMLEDKGD